MGLSMRVEVRKLVKEWMDACDLRMFLVARNYETLVFYLRYIHIRIEALAAVTASQRYLGTTDVN